MDLVGLVHFNAVVAAGNTGSVPVSVLWAGAAAVVVAAVITAIGVNLQTKRTLRSERDRLNSRLSHERAMREREELRKLVDDAAARLDILTFEVDDARELREKIEADRDETGLGEGESEAFDEQLATVFDGLREADTLGARLAVRLGQEHPIFKRYHAAWEIYHDYRREIAKPDGEPDPRAFSKAGLEAGAFLRASHELLHSELDP